MKFTKFHKYRFISFGDDAWGRTDGRTEGQTFTYTFSGNDVQVRVTFLWSEAQLQPQDHGFEFRSGQA